ncbi:sigma-70 family RNA polymerase sigma factor [Bradyrhizobium sp. CSA112]|uniref:RNA polymerase sigma factor n=1 Tax=Bradyrhizobium sp. CSA112 TaxID=2699170 RepID=UPI0023B09FF8|nr:sigma-70 family RNA polymerase sigma factor [Bradyrhizobium sp. CSA112]
MRAVLESGYRRFQERLRRRLGSDALATEVLHETWLRVGRMGDVGLVQRPESYLFRVALNVAADRREAHSRKLSAAEIETLRHMMDEVLDPERIATARAEMAALEGALNELTPRRKAIFVLARVSEMKHEDIALRFGISARMVEKELLHALRHCSQRLDRKMIRRFGPGAQKRS